MTAHLLLRWLHISMGTMALLAAVFVPNAGNVMGGLLASYLMLTAWTTVWRELRRLRAPRPVPLR